MKNKSFNAFLVKEIVPGKFEKGLEVREIDSLPPGDLLVKVEYSALNYKDALSASGHKGITRYYPHTPGIDAAGYVEESTNENYKPGERILVTGYDLGMNTSGGFSEYIRIPAEWVVRLPDEISFRESMIYGTSGYTAALGINALQNAGIGKDRGKVLVTGATGGVGTLAVAMLSKAGYSVTASTGKINSKDWLMALGADEIISREDVSDKSGKPLLPKKWHGAIDNAGGNTLSTIVRSLHQHGAVAAVGIVDSVELNLTLYPFILRGVQILGIDSADTPMEKRLNIWNRIWNEFRLDNTADFIKEISLNEISQNIDLMLKGGQLGKVIVKIG